ncbi:zinc finger BED domain-containing 4-like protein [Labeo rohita]|uniref:Zinc finger BED domain-containing 4-like protein n=1 Tax=Labeo rohita TaxID=84645 RepID=A0A498P4P5_LABRO|nr:zinc finger BED domain-containing 4-like protein [Labeo rohita]
MSAVWNYFKVNEDDKTKADCKLCSAKLSRGGSKGSAFNTSNLIKHLKSQHDNEYKEFTQAPKPTQLTLQQTLARREKMSRDNPRAVKITQAIIEYIALSDQPLSEVENVGFLHLLHVLEPRYDVPSRRYMTDTELPKLHDSVKKHIHSLLQTSSAFSFTTDIWTSSVSPVSLISLTSQWIDESFTPQRAILHVKQLRGLHTSQAIVHVFEEMLQTWGIPKTSVHVVLRDNAKNMIKAMNDAGLPSLPCVAHTLQLAVHEGLLAQRSTADAIAVGRKIVGHFKHSALAYSRLEDIQGQLNQPIKRLQQDVQTCWNSTYYMLQSLIEQKRVLGVYVSEHELPVSPLTNGLLSVAILAPFEELTKKVSSYDALASDVIPAVTVLVRLLNRETDEDHGVKTMKATLLAAVKKRFSDVETNPLYFISTILDPRYKDRFFSNNTAPEAKLHLKQELQMMSRAEAEGSRAEAAEPPAKLFLKAQASTSSSLDTVFEEIAKEQPQAAQPLAAGAAIELDTYLGEAPSPREDSPLKYWGVNKIRFPTLAKMAHKYLSAPCSSVESERLFSSVSHIIDENRNRLTADNAEKLLFLKKKPATHFF